MPELQVSDDVLQVRELPAQFRVSYVMNLRITYPRIQQIFEQLKTQCMASSGVSPEPTCIALVGPLGVGKTTIFEMLMDEYPRTKIQGGHLMPFVWARIDSPATTTTVPVKILEAMGDPLFAKHERISSNRGSRLRNLLKDAQTKLVGLDEFQHYIDRGKNKIMSDVTDQLKDLIKDTRIAFVISGLEGEVEKVIASNHPLESLFLDPIRLHPFRWIVGEPDTILEFRNVLLALEKALPLQQESHLSTYDLSWRIFCATDGLMRYLMRLIRYSVVEALDRKQEYIDAEILSDVFEQRLAPETRKLQNPFVGDPPLYAHSRDK